MESLLVTGGSGFIGSNLCRYLVKKYKDNMTIDYSRHTYAMNPLLTKDLEKNANYKFIAGDVTDALLLSKIIGEYNVTSIFHLAASTHVDRSFLYPQEFLQTNVFGTFTLLEVIRRLEKKPKLLFMSTDEVFGDVPSPHKCSENERTSPRNPYSASKASAEAYCNAYFHSFQVPVLMARSMNNFGGGQHPEKLVAKIITRSLSEAQFTLFKGGATRGWIYVEDTCNALDQILEKGKCGEVYHIPATVYLDVTAVAMKILRIIDKEYLFKGFKGTRLKDDERYALAGEKMKKELNWQPEVGFDDGIRRTIEWYKQNEWFWKGVSSP